MVVFGQNPVNATLIFVEIVKARFKTDYEKNQQTNRNTHRKSKNIYNGISFISSEISKTDPEIIL